MSRAHTITTATAQAIAKDMRSRRFAYERKRAGRRQTSTELPVMHYKTPSGGIPAGVAGGQMGSAVCTKYECSATGLKTLGTQTDTIWNDFGAIVGNKDIIVDTNDAGLLVVIAVRC